MINRTDGWALVASDSDTGITGHIEGQVEYLMKSGLVRDWWHQNALRTFSPAFVSGSRQSGKQIASLLEALDSTLS